MSVSYKKSKSSLLSSKSILSWEKDKRTIEDLLASLRIFLSDYEQSPDWHSLDLAFKRSILERWTSDHRVAHRLFPIASITIKAWYNVTFVLNDEGLIVALAVLIPDPSQSYLDYRSTAPEIFQTWNDCMPPSPSRMLH